MKRTIALALAALLLTGCAITGPSEPTGEPTTEPSTQETLDPGLYDPESLLEAQTGGAVRVYPLEEACDGIWILGDRVVLQQGENQTRLDLYTGEDLVLEASIPRNPPMNADGIGTQLTDQGLAYYHAGTGTLVVLDSQLQERYLYSMTDQVQGIPVLSHDLATAYYCTDEGIRALDLETGIAHMLRLQDSRLSELTGSCFDGELLVCVTQEEDRTVTEFIQSANGQSVGRDLSLVQVDTYGDRYFLIREPEGQRVYQFGTRGQAMEQFTPADPSVQVVPLLEGNCVLTVSTGYNTTLDLYDLDSGLRTASVTLEDISAQGFTWDSRGWIWFLGNDDLLCRWDPSRSGLEEAVSYINPWYTLETPDEEGLAQCQAEADRIGQTYGVELRLWQSALEGLWQDMTPEYRVEVYEDCLAQAEEVLALFPEDILVQMGSLCASGKITISLVGDCGFEGCAQEWSDGNAYIAVATDDSFRENLLGMLYRVMDTYVLSQTSMLDSWKAEKPVEDRMNLFRQALEVDNGEYFEASGVQKQLKTLCQAIRRAFGLRKYESVLPWEQYLETPLY